MKSNKEVAMEFLEWVAGKNYHNMPRYISVVDEGDGKIWITPDNVFNNVSASVRKKYRITTEEVYKEFERIYG
jgi:hypothetical protein